MEHIFQRYSFHQEIIENNIKVSKIIFTDECKIVLYTKDNPKINIICIIEEDKKDIHFCEVNEKRTFRLPKFEISIMFAGGIRQYCLSNPCFC